MASKMYTLVVLGAFLSILSSVSAHGYVQEITLDNTIYTGYLPFSDPYYSTPPQRIVRKIPGNGPVTDLSLIDVQCNGNSSGGIIGSSPAPLVGTYAAGSTIFVNWTTMPDSHLGPIITYIAAAPSDITSWSPGTSAVWAKIAESGYTNGVWATKALIDNQSIYSFTIPSTLMPGQYLIRHEIIALHNAYAYPGAQVFPSCIQINVIGNVSALPTTNLVSFPGAYNASTLGIHFDIYNAFSSYPIPGPDVWTG